MLAAHPERPEPGPPGDAGPSRFLGARRIALVVVAGAGVIQGASAVIRPRGDFLNHLEWARRLLAGTFLYDGGLNVPYTPIWAVLHVPFTFLPVRVAVAAIFAIGVAACAVVLALLHRAAGRVGVPEERLFWVDLAALLLAGRFLLRDLADGGPNLVLLALVWGGFHLWSRGRDIPGGALIGLATALKWTPALILAWLLFRRQTRAVLAGVAATAAVTLLPALWMGLPSWRSHMRVWVRTVATGVASSDPAVGVLGPEPARNLALRPVAGRLLMGRPFHLTPRHAAFVGWAATLSLIALCAWTFRRRPASRRDARLPLELAAVSLLALLLSPVAWRSHAVVALPAIFLLAHGAARRGALSRGLAFLLGAWTLVILVLNRAIVGSSVVGLFEELGLYTALFVALLGAVLVEAGRARSGSVRMTVTL